MSKNATISYDLDSGDLGSGQTLTAKWNVVKANTALPNGRSVVFGNGLTVQSPPLPAGPNQYVYNEAYNLSASRFKISLTRFYDGKLTPTFAADGVTVTNLNFQISINNIVSTNSQLPNDYLDCECIANWWSNMIKTGFTNLAMPTCTAPNVIATFTSDIPDKFEHATNVVDRFIPMNNSDINLSSKLIEHGTNVTVKVISDNPANSRSNPSQLLDYLFQYTYPIAFLGAALYGITSIISIDVTSVIANKNLSVVLNSIIGLCGYIGLCYFYNIPVVMLATFFNPNVIKISNAS